MAFALTCVVAASFASTPPTAAPAPASVAGTAQVIDGDTIDLLGERVRLEGIDAPETSQTCSRRLFGTWRCGAAATKALRNMVEGRTVTCDRRGTDKYGRMLGVCYAGGVDINRRMVEDGNAWAFLKYSASYAAVEKQARAARRGVFSTDNQPPWEYRRRHWAGAEQKAPDRCAIKGNVTRNGRIYHVPWSPWYAKLVINDARGERWFCSEGEAVEAG